MRIRYAFVFVLLSATLASLADTTWISTSSGTYSTAANWDNGVPSTGPQLAIFQDSAAIQHVLDLAGVSRNTVGIRFDLFSGGSGFTFNSSAASAFGFQVRATNISGTGATLLNNDDSAQTFNVPMAMFSPIAGTGAGAAQTWMAAAGNMIFSGIYNGGATSRATVTNNGGRLTIDGAFNTTIGSATGRGDIRGAGGLTKNGAGTLTLGGTLPNDYSGGTVINAGRIIANKPNALGTGPLVLNGGILETGGYSQMLGTLDLDSGAAIDFGAGDSDLVFADSDSQDWNGSLLTILNWTEGVDSIRVGTDGTGFDTQLPLFRFADFGNAPGQIDANGFITPAPVPEPSTVALAVVGGLAILVLLRRRA
jgi:autotransporter-associated beta strand protein